MKHQRIELWDREAYGTAAGDWVPTLTTYILEGDKERPAVIVCPGGGYRFTSPREAEPIALKFNSAGYHAFVLDYSVAPRRYPQALLDAARAIRIVRENASAWRVVGDKIAVCGFSAGAHVAASLGTLWDTSLVAGAASAPGAPRSHNAPQASARPDALILCYPVISSGEFAHRGSFENLLGPEATKEELAAMSLELRVDERTPPTFLWHTYDDPSVPLENSLLFARALREKKIPFELHVYPHGPHGLSLATKETDSGDMGSFPHVATWMGLCVEWLEGLWEAPKS
jgi:acetyl esterase/lipase